MTNIAIFDGNLAGEPELTFGKNKGDAMVRFTVMNNETYRDATGKWVDAGKVAFRCVAYGKLAENIAETFRSGNERVTVTATYTQRTVEKDGEKRTYNSFKILNIGPDLTFNIAEVPGGKQGGSRASAQHSPSEEPAWA